MSKKNNNSGRYCMFCGRRESEVSLLLQGMDACICADCVKLALFDDCRIDITVKH